MFGVFTAGADLIITNTYQATVEGFMEHLGVTAEEGYELIVRAVELAKKARTLYMEEYQDYIQDGEFPILLIKILISNEFMKVLQLD